MPPGAHAGHPPPQAQANPSLTAIDGAMDESRPTLGSARFAPPRRICRRLPFGLGRAFALFIPKDQAIPFLAAFFVVFLAVAFLTLFLLDFLAALFFATFSSLHPTGIKPGPTTTYPTGARQFP